MKGTQVQLNISSKAKVRVIKQISDVSWAAKTGLTVSYCYCFLKYVVLFSTKSPDCYLNLILSERRSESQEK